MDNQIFIMFESLNISVSYEPKMDIMYKCYELKITRHSFFQQYVL